MGKAILGMQNTTTDPYNIKIVKKVNESANLSFSILKTNNESNANYRIGEVIEFGELVYLVDTIKENVDDNNVVILEVTALQNSINLSKMLTKQKEFKNTPVIDIIKYVLENTGWSLGSNDIDASVTLDFEVKDKEAVSKVLLDIVENIDGVLIYEKNTVTVFRNHGNILPINDETNIISVNSNADTGNLLTRVYGYGANDSSGDPITVTQVNPTGLPYVENYSYFLSLGYEENYIKNNPTIFVREGSYEDDSITSAQTLLTKTQEYLERYCKPTLNCDLTLSLTNTNMANSIKLNMYRNIYDEQTNEYVPCRVTSITQEFNDELTLKLVLKSEYKYGDYTSNIVAKIDKIDTKVEYVWDKVIDGTIQEVTDLIKKGINGYVVVNENEILIMDTNDKNTATYVWRWNSGGLGFSSNGYNGTYSLAMTSNGQIVADMITTGNLNAKLIKVGILQSLNNKTWINMEDGTFSLANGAISYDGNTFHIDRAVKINPNLIWDGTFMFDTTYWTTSADSIYTGSMPSWLPVDEGIGIKGKYGSYTEIVSNKILIQTNQKYTLSFNCQVESSINEFVVYVYLYDKENNYLGADKIISMGTTSAYISDKRIQNYTPTNSSAKYIALAFRNTGLKSNTGNYICVFLNKIKFEVDEEATAYIGSEIAINNNELRTTIGKQLGAYCTQSEMTQYADGIKASVKSEVGNTYATKSELSATENRINATVSSELDGCITKSEAELTATELIMNFTNSTVNMIEDGGFETGSNSIGNVNGGATVQFLSAIDNVSTLDGGKCCHISGTARDCYATLYDRTFVLEPNTTYTISGYTRGATLGNYLTSSAYLSSDSDYFGIFMGEDLATGDNWQYRTTTFTTGALNKKTFHLRLGWKLNNSAYGWAAFDQMMLVKGKTAIPYNDGNGYYDTNMTIGKDGIKCTYTNGTYTEMSPQGFKYYEAGSGYSYCSLITYGVYTVNITANNSVGTATVTLPSVFKGKNLSTVISFNQLDMPKEQISSNSYYAMLGFEMGASGSADPNTGILTLWYRCGYPRGSISDGKIVNNGYATTTATIKINYIVFGRY